MVQLLEGHIFPMHDNVYFLQVMETPLAIQDRKGTNKITESFIKREANGINKGKERKLAYGQKGDNLFLRYVSE